MVGVSTYRFASTARCILIESIEEREIEYERIGLRSRDDRMAISKDKFLAGESYM